MRYRWSQLPMRLFFPNMKLAIQEAFPYINSQAFTLFSVHSTTLLYLWFPANPQPRHTRSELSPGRQVHQPQGRTEGRSSRCPDPPTIGWRRSRSHISPSPSRWWIQPSYRVTDRGRARLGKILIRPTVHLLCVLLSVTYCCPYVLYPLPIFAIRIFVHGVLFVLTYFIPYVHLLYVLLSITYFCSCVLYT